MEKDIYVYSLKDPNTYEIKYIGKTNNLNRRYKEHIETHRNKKSKKNSWVISLLNKKMHPIMEIVEKCNIENWQEREIYWIKYYKELGFNLKNIQNGGGRNKYVFTEESRKKMSKSQKERWEQSTPKYKTDKQGRDICSVNAKNNKNILNNLKLGSKSCRIPVIQLSLNNEKIKEWVSLSEAARILNINVGNINKCLKGKTKTCGGFRWIYKSDVSNNAYPVKPEAHLSPLGVGG